MRACLVVGVLAAAGWAMDLESAHQQARAALVEDLEKLADWCTKSRVFLDRNRTYELILDFDPDHETARKWLRFRKTKNGWVSRGFTRPINHEPEHHTTWTRKLKEVGLRFADRLAAAVAATKAPPSVKAKVFADLFRLAPDHEQGRRLNGQVRYRNRWMLRETVASRQRRRMIARFARTATFNVGNPRRGSLKSWERAMGIGFTEVWETPTWRLVTTCGAGEGETAARLAGACHEFIELVFDVTVPPTSGRLVFMLKSTKRYPTFAAVAV